MRKLPHVLGAGLVALAATHAAAQTAYPEKSVTLVVPWSAGGALDSLARRLQSSLAKALGQSIIIDNPTGANGTVGTAAVARAKTDGYTLLFTIEAHILNQTLYKNLSYHALKDFAPVAQVAIAPMTLLVNPKLPVNSVADVVRLAKEKPGSINYGSIGLGSQHHLVGVRFAQQTQIEIQHVPYRGGAPALNDLVAGHVQIMFSSVTSTFPLVQSGQLKALAALWPERLPHLPDVPTMAEAGYPGLIAASWFGMLAPKGTPPEIIAKLHAALAEAIESPEAKEGLAALKLQVNFSKSPDDFAKFLGEELERYERVVREQNLTIN
jgi:tripartite-type tricarboxylate transporter receptor subunit TctC